jgi:hypothetical protein
MDKTAEQKLKEPLLTETNETAEKDCCSVVVKNLKKSEQLQSTLNNFFSFCGAISSTSIVDDPNDPALVIATLTFHEPSSAKTAVLLNNTQINERFITVELLRDVKSREYARAKMTPSVVDDLVNMVPVLEPVREVGRSIDEKIHLTEAIGSVKEKVRNLDEEYHVSETIHNKATEIDNNWQISNNVSYVKDSLCKLEEEHHITQKVTEGAILAGGAIVAGLEIGAQQVAEFMRTNETAKAGVDYVNNVGQDLSNQINNWWSGVVSYTTTTASTSTTSTTSTTTTTSTTSMASTALTTATTSSTSSTSTTISTSYTPLKETSTALNTTKMPPTTTTTREEISSST